MEVQTPLSDARAGKKDDEQASVSVHECGHAIVNMMLFHTVPIAISSTSAEADTRGFILAGGIEKLWTGKDYCHYVALLLAGGIAERIVFGNDFRSGGSYGDIKKATRVACGMFRRQGFGKRSMHLGVVFTQDDEALHDNSVEEEIENFMQEAAAQAEKLLKQEERLLLKLAAHLADHSRLERSQILEFCKEWSNTGLYERLTSKEKLECGHRDILLRAVQRQEASEFRFISIINGIRRTCTSNEDTTPVHHSTAG